MSSKAKYYTAAMVLLLLTVAGCGGGGEGGGSSGSCSACLIWTAPTTNSDLTPIYDLAGYYLKYGPASGSHPTTVTIVGANNTSYPFSSITPGYHCFVVTAYDTSGNQSVNSNELCTTVP